MGTLGMPQITVRGLRALRLGGEISDKAPRGAGALSARKRASGSVMFYFRYTTPDGARDPYPLGEWDGTGGPLSLEGARVRANELSARYRAGARDLRAVLETEEREARREREAVARAESDAKARAGATLGALLDAYADALESRKRASASAVRAALRRHVCEAWPLLWQTPADDVTTDHLMPILTRLTDNGKLREAAKVRSYLQAAYNAGMRARTTASATPALRSLRIRTNPARDLGTIEGASKARERALSVAELRAYWTRVRDMPDQEGACLRFHLLSGGQRLDQMARLTLADYDDEQATITIRDMKGRRSSARVHVVPLIPEAVSAMVAMLPAMPEGELGNADGGRRHREGDFLFTATAGKSGMASSTAYLRCREVMEAMLEAKELPGGTFSLNDIRRTVETRLADLGVHSDVRAQLQSHGLGGVQARHYDRHDYLHEKREALERLHQLISGSGAKVVPLRRTTSAA